MITDWRNSEVIGISGIKIEMPNKTKITMFTDNDLTHITDDHFQINLIKLFACCVHASLHIFTKYYGFPYVEA